MKTINTTCIRDASLKDFFRHILKENLKIYNEESLKFELGYFFRKKGYKILFEINIKSLPCKNQNKYPKRKIDLLLEKGKSKTAIELKFPGDGSETFASFMKDIHFCQRLVKDGLVANGYCLNIVNNKNHCEFMTDKDIKNITNKYNGKYPRYKTRIKMYKFFRGEGKWDKNDPYMTLKPSKGGNCHLLESIDENIIWNDLLGNKKYKRIKDIIKNYDPDKKRVIKYYLLEIAQNMKK